MQTTFSRRERRTEGKKILKRLAELKNSQILKDADLSGLPEDVVKKLREGTCENQALQKRYKTCQKILDEVLRLELTLRAMKQDLAVKKGILNIPKKDITNVD